MFGFVPFYFYIFIKKAPAGGKPVVKIIVLLLMFSAREKLIIISDFTGQDGFCRLFLCLVTSDFGHYNKPTFEFSLKTGDIAKL